MSQRARGTHRRGLFAWTCAWALTWALISAACSNPVRNFGTVPDASTGGSAGAYDEPMSVSGAGGGKTNASGGSSGALGGIGASGDSSVAGANQNVELGALGAECSQDADCEKGHCADGVCCESACDDTCHQCNLEHLLGTCAPVPDGQTAPPPHPACTKDSPSSCMKDGVCDGAGSCRLYPNGAVCGGANCASATQQVVTGSHCDGRGSCVAETAVSCSPFKCDAAGKACATSCGSAQECIGQPCLQGSCGTVANGSVCTADDQCQSAHCVDGYCCNEACTDACNACDITGTIGKCSQVPSGQPHGKRPECEGAGAVCGGTCSPVSKACTFDSTKTCSNASCSDGTTTAAAKCGGAGHCPSGATGSCGGFACNGGSCYGSCTTDGQCASATPYCNGGTCSKTKPIGKTCAGNGECTSGHCVQTACCATAANACGGCGALTGKVGDACGTCGKLACQGSVLACTGSGVDNGCGGCDTTHHKYDACGTCSNGAYACAGTSVACQGATDNGCGGCDLTHKKGAVCGTCNNGTYACSGTSAVCQGATDNGCGGCDLTHKKGDACGSCGGQYDCSGTSVVCNGTDNGCGGCSPLVADGGAFNNSLPHQPGMVCNSCNPGAGTWQCNSKTTVSCHDNCGAIDANNPICCYNYANVCSGLAPANCVCSNFCE